MSNDPTLYSHVQTYFSEYRCPEDINMKMQPEPIVAWKLAQVGMKYGEIQFQATNVDVQYKTYDHAICVNLPHTAPDAKCSCGFYAFASLHNLMNEYGTRFTEANWKVLLQVEIYGVVVKHQYGYRAQKQRVLTAYCADRIQMTARDSWEVRFQPNHISRQELADALKVDCKEMREVFYLQM